MRLAVARKVTIAIVTTHAIAQAVRIALLEIYVFLDTLIKKLALQSSEPMPAVPAKERREKEKARKEKAEERAKANTKAPTHVIRLDPNTAAHIPSLKRPFKSRKLIQVNSAQDFSLSTMTVHSPSMGTQTSKAASTRKSSHRIQECKVRQCFSWFASRAH